MTRHAMANSKRLSDLDLVLAVVGLEESLDGVYAKNKVRDKSREPTVAGQTNWLTLGRVRLRFRSDVMLLEFGLLPASLALFSGSLMLGGAFFWRLSASCWFLADSCTLRVRYCLFFCRRGPWWRSVSLSRRSYSNKNKTQNEETDKSSPTKASLITNIVTQRPNRATLFSRPGRRFREKRFSLCSIV